MEISGSKLKRFGRLKVGKLGEMLYPLETKQIHGSKSTKHHQTNKSQKNLGLFLVGIFETGEETNKTRLETQRGGSEIVINVAHDTKMMWSGTPYGRSFTKGANPYEECDEHEGKHEGNTREITRPTRIDHTCARSMNTKVRYKIQSQQRTIQTVTGSSP